LILSNSNTDMNKPKGQKAKALLIKIATSLFAEKGYASTSVREIVERAGVTKPVLYYYFKNKEGLFHAILEEAYLELEALLAQQLESQESFHDRIVAFSRQLYNLGMAHQDLNRMAQNLMFGPPKGVPAYDFDRYRERILHAIRAIYEEGLARNEVKESDPEEVAFLVFGLLSFCFNLDCLHPETADPERPLRLLRMIIRGLENQNPVEDAV
jgi:TetR/AcrR family transcriptional regulator